MNKTNIFIQDGAIIKTLHPTNVVNARIYNEPQRQEIYRLIREGYFPHHSSVGTGKITNAHYNVIPYKGRFGEGYKMISSSPYSSNFNHLTYFIKLLA